MSRKVFGRRSGVSETQGVLHPDIYDIALAKLNGGQIDLKAYKGRYLLIVNVASKCGFTGQYGDLERLYQQYKDRLMIIGVPCNQFGGQEPGTAEQIQTFCELNYGVSFPMSEKIKVKGHDQHPLYQWLTEKRLNGRFSSSVKWNFQKYLISPEGKLLKVFYSLTKPTSSRITRFLS